MKHQQNQFYRYELLRPIFYISKETGEWRLYHAIERDTPNRRTYRPVGSLADTSIIAKGYRMCALPQRVNGKQIRLVASAVIWCLYNRRDIPPGQLVDHEDRDKLNNNPETNLRLLDCHSSAVNRRTSDGGFIGLAPPIERVKPTSKRWQALGTDPKTGKRVGLGFYLTPEGAARVYDRFVIEKYGPDAITNASLGLL